MVDSCVAYTEATKPCARKYARHVHGPVPNWFFLGEKAMYRVQRRLSSGSVFNMLQWHRGELSVLGHSV